MSDEEWDKLRHLAIRRDVLHLAHGELRTTEILSATATSVLRLDPGLQAEALACTRRWDRDGKVGFVVARSELFLPLLDLAYFDLIVCEMPTRPLPGSLADGPDVAGLEEDLQLIAIGCRPDACVVVTDYRPTDRATACAAEAVDRWVIKTGRSLVQHGSLGVIHCARKSCR